MTMRLKFSALALAAALLAPPAGVSAQDGAPQRERNERPRRVAAEPAAAESPAAAPRGRYQGDESPRSDKFTGGRVESAQFAAGEPDIRVTVDVPAFRLTLWQNDKEVKTYRVGVGLRDYPITISERKAAEIIWNPDWIPPDSDWVTGRKGVKAGEVIKASDPRNPLGKLKIPLGSGYLIHEAKGIGDLGSLVSHGCVRMMRADLYDLAEKIVAARGLAVTARQIANAKRTKNTVVAKLDEPLVVDINYDTLVVEGGELHLFADFYNRGTNTPANLRAELRENGVDVSALEDAALKKLLARPTQRQKFVVNLESVAAGRALADGRPVSVVGAPATPAKKRPAAKRPARAA